MTSRQTSIGNPRTPEQASEEQRKDDLYAALERAYVELESVTEHAVAGKDAHLLDLTRIALNATARAMDVLR